MQNRRSIFGSGWFLALGVGMMVAGCTDDQILRSPDQEPRNAGIILENNPVIEDEPEEIHFVTFDTDGNEIDYLPPWISPEWSIEQDGIIDIDEETLTGLTPGQTELFIEIGEYTGSKTIRVNPKQFQARFEDPYVVQNAQTPDRSVPVVTNNDGLLRIFATADQINFYDPPNVKVWIYSGNTVVEEVSLEPDLDISTIPKVPEEIDESEAGISWNLPLSADLIDPDLRVRLQFDPDNTLPLTAGSHIWYPSEHQAESFEVRSVPRFRVRFVPVEQDGVSIGNVTESNVDSFLDFTRRVLPLDQVDVDVRAPYTTTLRADSDSGWMGILSEIRALRQSDGSSRYYHGIVERLGSWAGMAYIGYPVAVSYDALPQAAETVAHEFGHNFGLLHAPCGGPSNVDTNYPYSDGSIGVFGFDRVTNTIVEPDTPDVMSYCSPRWISDYHVKKVYDFRRDEAASEPQDVLADQETILIWGQIGRDEIVVEPSFYIRSWPELPDGSGAYTLEMIDESGNTVFSDSFDPDPVADGPEGMKHFLFSIPVNRLASVDIEKIRVYGRGLHGEIATSLSNSFRQQLVRDDTEVPDLQAQAVSRDEITLRWDENRYPMIMVRHPDTGEVLSFARGGEVTLTLDAPEVELNISDGVASYQRILPIEER